MCAFVLATKAQAIAVDNADSRIVEKIGAALPVVGAVFVVGVEEKYFPRGPYVCIIGPAESSGLAAGSGGL